MDIKEGSPKKDWEPLVPVVYYCKDCNTSKPKYRVSWEAGNTDYRQYCWKCTKITEHTQPVKASG